MAQSTRSTERFEALDGWRGVCALGVALNHLWFFGHYRFIWAINNFHLFVDFFFVLSGFVISHAYGMKLKDSADLPPYLTKRLGRLYPLHIVTLLVLVAYQIIRPLFMGQGGGLFDVRNNPFSLLANLLLLQGMGVTNAASWNDPSWSISVEFFLYVTFGIVILLVRRLWPFVLACLLLCLVGAAAIFGWAPAIMDSTYDYGFARGLYGFFLGCLIYLLLMRRPGWRVPGGTIAELIVLMAIAWFLSHVGRGYASMAATPLFALAVWVFAQEPGWVSAALRSRVGRALGRWSYSIYMWHFVLIVGLFGAFKYLAGHTHSIRILDLTRITDGKPLLGVSFGSLWIGDLLAILFLLLVIAVAAASYALIERPGIRAFGRIARRMKRSATAPEAPGEGRIA